LAKLRPLVARVVEELAKELATACGPPDRPPAAATVPAAGGRLDMNRTIRANLASVRRRADGTIW